jgi:uncharacterized protein YqgQ
VFARHDRIYEDIVKEVVLSAFKQSAALAMIIRDEMKNVNKQNNAEQSGISEQLIKLSGKERQLAERKAKLFEDYAGGIISKEQYLESKSALASELENISARKAELESKTKNILPIAETNGIIGVLEKLNQTEEVTMEMVSFINRINIFSSGRIEVQFTFADELARLGAFIKN